MLAILVGGVGENQRVSVQFQDLPLDEGLRRILKDQDAFFFYGVEDNASASLRVVWVYPKGRGNGLAPTPPETWASTIELEGRLADPDPEARARATEALIERKGGAALDVVLQALKDRDDQVRNRVLYKALNSGIKLPSDFLYQLVLTDPLLEVRFMAITAFAEDPNMGADDLNNVKALAKEVMTTDPSSEVRNQAQQILDQLSAQTTG
jgi:HEAT repeat protein